MLRLILAASVTEPATAVSIAAVAVTIMDLVFLASQDAVVADRDAMRVTSQIVQELARPGEGSLGVDHPGFYRFAAREEVNSLR